LNSGAFFHDRFVSKDKASRLQKNIVVQNRLTKTPDVVGGWWGGNDGITHFIDSKPHVLDRPIKAIEDAFKGLSGYQWAKALYKARPSAHKDPFTSLLTLAGEASKIPVKLLTGKGLLYMGGQGVTTHFLSNFYDDEKKDIQKKSHLRDIMSNHAILEDQLRDEYHTLSQNLMGQEEMAGKSVEEEEASEPIAGLKLGEYYHGGEDVPIRYHSDLDRGYTSVGRAMSDAGDMGVRGYSGEVGADAKQPEQVSRQVNHEPKRETEQHPRSRETRSQGVHWGMESYYPIRGHKRAQSGLYSETDNRPMADSEHHQRKKRVDNYITDTEWTHYKEKMGGYAKETEDERHAFRHNLLDEFGAEDSKKNVCEVYRHDPNKYKECLRQMFSPN